MLAKLKLPTLAQMRTKICNVTGDTNISFCLCAYFFYLKKAVRYVWVESGD